MRVEDVRALPLFDGLTDAQLRELVAGGSEFTFEPGDELFHEGEPADFWWVLVEGSIELVRHLGREPTVVAHMDVPGRWAGGFRAWDEQGVYLATGRGLTAGRGLRVPAPVLRELSTAWFPFAGHLIAGLFHTARSIESTARQRGALLTLGTLAAGLAHELNNPAAATARAVDALEEANGSALSSLRRLADQNISANQYAALDELRREVTALPADVDALLRSDREQEVAGWLADHGVGPAWSIAPALVAAGADLPWCERAGEVLGAAALEPGLEWLASTFAVAALLAEVKESTRRVSELVAAVRSYSQMDRASMQLIDLTDGIESTLVVLGHKLRDGVTVVRDYGDDVPRIEAYPGELNQVWTNLIDNAVDAMKGAGQLRIGTRADGEHVLVEIADTGEGMTPEVAARAFEAFYTTKDVGQGTGLGLDIARRIVVERHAGEITLDSRPGDTVVRVSLPVRMAAPA